MEQKAASKDFHIIRGTRLTIELGTRLVVEFDGIKGNFEVILVGIEHERYLIARKLPTASIQGLLVEGSLATLRYAYLGNVFGFRSNVIDYVSSPFKLIFFSYPKTVEIVSLRKKVRTLCNIPTTAIIHQKGVEGMILDISITGCRCIFKVSSDKALEQIKVDDNIEIRFPLPGVEGVHAFQTKTRNITQEKEKIVLGVEFQEMDIRLSDRLEEWLSTVADFGESESV